MSIAPRLRRLPVFALAFAAATWLAAADHEALPDAALSGGNLTVADAGSGAYLQPASNAAACRRKSSGTACRNWPAGRRHGARELERARRHPG